eukprot:8075001-Ditylum_brightwellii.AAC.1
MPTIEMVKTQHDKAATTTCSFASIKNTQQSISSGFMKKTTKHQRRVLTETVTGIMAMIMMVAGMDLMVTATIIMVTGMAVTAHISCLVLEDTN